jgi:CelD/BcsL family acetyltransferase involved in cellulose biosynthesis
VSSDDDSRWGVSIHALELNSELEQEWQDVQERSDCSYFQSWGWVSAWAGGLPAHTMRLVRVRYADRTVGLGIVGQRLLRRHKIVPSRALLLFETGRPEFDSTTMEHNGLVLERGLEQQALTRVFAFLRKSRPRSDEILISGIDAARANDYAQSARAAGFLPVSRYAKPTFTVSIEALRSNGGDPLARLSANSRQQIRRAIRGYESLGELTVEEARTVAEAHAFLSELRVLHEAHWHARGQPGAFASPFTRTLHATLIDSRFARGEVQLLRVKAGARVVGYLYNFRLAGTVYNYQTGFAYDSDSKLKPGLVCHVKAIEHCMATGIRTYDLLMGEQRYKRSLCDTEGQMLWVALHRWPLRFHLDRISGSRPMEHTR